MRWLAALIFFGCAVEALFSISPPHGRYKTRGQAIASTIVALILLVAIVPKESWTERPAPAPTAVNLQAQQSAPLQVVSSQKIDVPSDPRATFELVDASRPTNGHVVITTKRTGPSGVSFSRRECDCKGSQFRYLGDGDTLEAARKAKSPPEKMVRLVRDAASGNGSVSFHVCDYACKSKGSEVNKATAAPAVIAKPAAPKASEFDIRSQALILCMRYAKASARHPSTVNFSGWGSNVDVRSDGSAIVTAPFTAKNSFNLEIEHTIRCNVTAAGDISAEISESR